MLRRTAFAENLNTAPGKSPGNSPGHSSGKSLGKSPGAMGPSLVAFAAMLAVVWGSCLWPREFSATGSLVPQADPQLTQIQNAPLQQALSQLLTQKIPAITTTAPSAKEAAHQANLALQQKQQDTLASLQPALTLAWQQQKNSFAQTQQKIQQIDQQLAQLATQNPQGFTTGDLQPQRDAIKATLAKANHNLKKLKHQQAVWAGSNRTLSGLLARRTLLTRDLSLHLTKLGRSEDHPVVRQTRSQIQKLQVRIDALQNATNLDEHADQKIHALALAITAAKKNITQQQQTLTTLAAIEKSLAQMATLRPERQALMAQLGPQKIQLKHLATALRGQWQVLQIRKATPEQAQLLSPTPPQVALIACFVGLMVWISMTYVCRYFDQTLHNATDVSEQLDLPVLGCITASPKHRWFKPTLKLAMAAVLIVSFGVVHWPQTIKWNPQIHSPQPVQTQQVALD